LGKRRFQNGPPTFDGNDRRKRFPLFPKLFQILRIGLKNIELATALKCGRKPVPMAQTSPTIRTPLTPEFLRHLRHP
jgi:hypothetical protein